MEKNYQSYYVTSFVIFKSVSQDKTERQELDGCLTDDKKLISWMFCYSETFKCYLQFLSWKQ